MIRLPAARNNHIPSDMAGSHEKADGVRTDCAANAPQTHGSRGPQHADVKRENLRRIDRGAAHAYFTEKPGEGGNQEQLGCSLGPNREAERNA